MKTFKLARKIFTFSLIALITLGGVSSCKSSKKAAEEAAKKEMAEKISTAKSDLNAILAADLSTMEAIDENQAKLDAIKQMNLPDEEVKALTNQAEEAIAEARGILEEQKRKEEEAKRIAAEKQAALERESKDIYYYFDKVAGSASTGQANQLINEALGLFTSPDADVLILIYQDGEDKDYDEPTTIEKYLNYIKDKEKSPYKINEIEKDDNGKIKLLELKK
ncbi:hypothetical protein [Sediminitomix flava]|nr:hypothetical protein [Sediminitomix flava]